MKKKAQNVGQIFIYVLSIVVVGVILLFGYQSIMAFQKNADKIGIVKFQKGLEASITSISSQYGTLQKKEFLLSSEYKQVCFVRNFETDESISISSKYNQNTFDSYPLILDSIDREGAQSSKPLPLKNVFLIKNNNQVAESFDIGQIALKDGDVFACFDVINSKLSIYIEGKGDHALISS